MAERARRKPGGGNDPSFVVELAAATGEQAERLRDEQARAVQEVLAWMQADPEHRRSHPTDISPHVDQRNEAA